MKSNILHIIAACLAAFALPFIAACSSQDESLQEVESSIQAVFTLDLGDAAKGKSRATPTDGNYDRGAGMENFIDLSNKDFRCYLFGMDNKAIDALNVVSIFNIKDSMYSVRLRLENTDEVKNALTNGCRFVFLANWGSYAELTPEMTIMELCSSLDAEFNFTQAKTRLSDQNLIPMYGVKEFDNGVPDFKAGKELSDIGTIHLLRAYAKIDVAVTFIDFEDEPEVESVSLTHSSSKGYKAPANVTKQSDYVTNSWITDYTPVNIPADAADIALSLTKDETSGHYIAYVPEYRNVKGQVTLDSRSRIEISFTVGDIENGGIKAEGYVDFRDSKISPEGNVTLGQHFDIARNNWYKFDVIVKGKDIDWIVDVIPFTAVDLKPDMGLERDEFTGYIVSKDSDGKVVCWYDGNYYDPSKAVPLYLGPKGHEGQFVTIEGKEYLLVYTDSERTAAKLDHFFEKETRKKYLLTPEGITGYKYGNDMYLNKQQQRVWLDSGGDPNGKDDAPAIFEALKNVGLELKCCRILYEWDRFDWNKARWWGWTGIYPKYWFDVLGNRYPWSDGDTEDKRKAVLGEWAQYLE